MEAYLFAHSLKEFARFRRIIGWLAVCLLIGAIGFVWPKIVIPGSIQEHYGDLSSMLLFRTIALASAILTTAIVGQEVEQKTIVYLLTRPVARWKLLLARYLASSLVVFLIGVIGAFVLSAVLFRGRPLTNELLPSDLEAMFLGAFAYGALFLLVSLFMVRAMIVCIVFAFVWETSVASMPGDLYRLSIFSYIQAVAQHPTTQGDKATALLSGQLSTNLISPSTGAAVLIAICLVVVPFCLWWFSANEFIPREDSE